MRLRIAQIVIVTLLGCGWGWAQRATQETAPGTEPAARPGAMATSLQPEYADLLARMRSLAKQTDNDVVSLRIERWKAHRGTKEQLYDSASAIHRNLAYAVPTLLQHAAAQPDSLKAAFDLYRDLNALYETFSSLTESAGAFGPSDSYDMLSGDLAQMDQLRHRLANRLEQMTAASDARLLRPQPQPSAGKGKVREGSSFHKIIVDEGHPSHHRRAHHYRAHHSRKKPAAKSQWHRKKPSAATPAH